MDAPRLDGRRKVEQLCRGGGYRRAKPVTRPVCSTSEHNPSCVIECPDDRLAVGTVGIAEHSPRRALTDELGCVTAQDLLCPVDVTRGQPQSCLLYTSDAADDLLCVD